MSQKGFTLAELLISVAIGAILLSIGVPSYSTFVRNARQTESANALLSDLHLARELAITRNARVTVCPSSDGDGCDADSWTEGWLVFGDTDADRVVDAGEQVDRVVTEVAAADIASTEFNGYLIYRPNGRAMVDDPRDNTGEFTLCDDRGAEHARVVQIDMSGRPRVARESLDGSEPDCS